MVQVDPNGGPDEAVFPSGGDGPLLAKCDDGFRSLLMPQRAVIARSGFAALGPSDVGRESRFELAKRGKQFPCTAANSEATSRAVAS